MAAETPTRRPWPVPESPEPAVPNGMRRVRFPAMGTTVTLLLPLPDAEPAGEAVRALFAVLEQRLSRFDPHSELSWLNRHAGRAVPVSTLLWATLTMALDAARATDGLYDPAMLHQVVALGYDQSFDRMSGQFPPASDWPGHGGLWRSIDMDYRHRSVTLPAGVGIDVGGMAKGMAVDMARSRLLAMGVTSALLNAGGDLAVHGVPPDGDAWPIAVQGYEDLGTVPLRRGALATSGTARRHWRQGTEARHHLLDPRSGFPAASGLTSVSVAAARCVQAEVAAKAAFVLGPDDGHRFLQEQGLAGLLVGDDGRRRTVGAWPDPRPGGRHD